MHLYMKNSVLALTLLSATSDAFMLATPQSRTITPTRTSSSSRAFVQSSNSNLKSVRLHAKEDSDSEIEKLRTMAAKLRAEAASMEAVKAQELADAAERAFRKFDTNQDGIVTLTELKAGLEKSLKMELPENRVKQLLADFDKTGDGQLQVEDFAGVDQFRNRLEALARDEKAAAVELTKTAKQEEETSKLMQAKMEMINDKPPTNTDKLVSIIPYLFPLLDSLQFANFLVNKNPENLFAGLAALLYTAYRSIPLGGFIAFFALNTLSGNPKINRLVRFNMQQAIYLDIALFFPGLLAALYSLVGQGLGFELPPAMIELGSDGLFLTLLATLGYASISSLLGVTPDKIPLVSKASNDRMPSIEMFDDKGRYKQKDDSEKKD
jgi:Ca2+-binding EF-hand superfamily protein